ncbi:MAG: FAD-dependent oxidoreductase [Peptoniphilus sp.]|nr:FAD-dependent oxidoreductase [Peptoniphilus sp.]MDD7363523.1 FAD-dependent oxidoreductase [Bacillota bacterium]MDY6044774.1 FAD-dependent oxidoreductase [Peptoniphilus sp.]
MKIVIVGGVAGGATALARMRRLNEDAEIILFERGKYISYANCGLPYYIGDTIERRDALFVADSKTVRERYRVDIREEHEVVKIDRDGKTVEVKNKATGEIYEESYDKLLLATGSHPFVPDSEGVDSENVFTLWTIPDADKIKSYIEKNGVKKAVVIGGGFIGLEMIENLVDLGIDATLVEMADQVMPPLDPDMARIVEHHLVRKGVHLLLGEGFKAIRENGKKVLLNSGKELETDMVLLSIGLRPNSGLARDSGLRLNAKGHIVVDEHMRTSDPDIYAIGDVVATKNYLTGEEAVVQLAGPANRQAREIASNLVGTGEGVYRGSLATSAAKIFDLTVASTGLSEKALRKQGKVFREDYLTTLIHPMNHVGYYPGAGQMTIKLIFALDGRVLGAQIVGYKGVDKRIDTISSAIHFKGTVDDLSRMEFAYAPPYSSAKDPVNFAGYVARDMLDGSTDVVTYDEWRENKDKYALIDVREEVELNAGMLEGAVNIPLGSLRERLDALDPEKNYLLYCAVGLRGYVAERILKQKGFKAYNLQGGFKTAMDRAPIDPTNVASSPAREASQTSSAEQSTPRKADANVEILDVCGLSCPGPIVQVSEAMERLEEGQILDVTATDPGFVRDIAAWANNTGNTLLDQSEDGGEFSARLKKGTGNAPASLEGDDGVSRSGIREKTMIVFDGDLDKAIASFIIANGAAAMGNKVHMFFTFWGLSILRKQNPPKRKKPFMDKMFSSMLPKGSKKLKLSRMNFMGMGPKMIRSVMEKKNIASLEELIRQAMDAGVELTACQMTMDIMGLTQDDLIDGVEIGGVATMLSNNDDSNMNLFI